MIDVHCHLESKEYDADLEQVMSKCRKELKAVITSCAHPRDFQKSLALVKKYPKFVYMTIGFHPSYIKEITDKLLDSYLDLVEKNKGFISGIGECGLDYYWVKEPELREKQKELFLEHIEVARNMNLPLVIHSRDAEMECLDLLELQNAKKVLLHFFSEKNLVEKVIKLGYFISVNTAIFKSKGLRKIVKEVPIEKIMTETDAPWLGNGDRNTPLSIRKVIKKIAEIKKMEVEETDRITTNNAINFFNL